MHNPITEKEALAIAESGIWKTLTKRELALLQLSTDRLFCDFSAFQEAVEELLGRPVWTHEFASNNLTREFLGLHQFEGPLESLEKVMSRN